MKRGFYLLYISSPTGENFSTASPKVSTSIVLFHSGSPKFPPKLLHGKALS
jgi:hypothetical protein